MSPPSHASLWDWRTWWAAFFALWPWGDLTPYWRDRGYDRAAPMTLRQHFAYVLNREELVYCSSFTIDMHLQSVQVTNSPVGIFWRPVQSNP